MEQLRDCAFCAGALTGVPAARNGAGPARVLLPASALNAAGLSSGELVLLALVQLPDEDISATTPGSARGRQGSASATPPRTPLSGSRGGNARPQPTAGADASPLLLSRRSESGEGDACAADADSQSPGERLLAAAVWPSQQLASGAASASAAVLEAASWPPAGTVLRVYPLAAPGSQQRVRARVTECVALTLRVCEAYGSESSAQPDAVPSSPLTPQSSHGSGATRTSVPAGSPAHKAGTPKSSGVRCVILPHVSLSRAEPWHAQRRAVAGPRDR